MTSPKELFKSDKLRAKQHIELVDNQEFKATLLAAFNEYCFNLPPSENPQSGWNANCKRQGAKEFMVTLMTLADEKRPSVKPLGTLEPV